MKRVVLGDDSEQLNEQSNWLRPKRQKMTNHHFNALRHFLIRSIGRPWNHVYAEVCASVDGRSLLGSQIRDFVEGCVSLKCWMDGRDIMSYDCRGCTQKVRGLYVHPKSGRLMRVT